MEFEGISRGKDEIGKHLGVDFEGVWVLVCQLGQCVFV